MTSESSQPLSFKEEGKLAAFFNTYNLSPPFVLALSGGPDSIFLFHLLCKANIPFYAAYFNHGWRKDAEKEELFCKKLCDAFKVPFYSGHALNWPLTRSTGSKEADGRAQRYAFLFDVQNRTNSSKVLLAHHQDDLIETILIRLTRKSFLDGYAGMREVEERTARPLLSYTKNYILSYLSKENISYCIDETNNSLNFLRNSIRHLLIPAWEKVDGRWKNSLLAAAKRWREEHELLETLLVPVYEKAVKKLEGKICLELSFFKNQQAAIKLKIVIYFLKMTSYTLPFSAQWIKEVVRFLNSNRGGKHLLAPTFSLVKKGKYAWVEFSCKTIS